MSRNSVRSISVEDCLDANERRWLEDWISLLPAFPFSGKSLGPFWFRELKVGAKRVYYIAGRQKILLLTVSTKNAQENELRRLREKLDALKAFADGHE